MEMINVLMEEIEQIRSDLPKVDVGSKEYVAMANRLDNLMSKVIEMDRVNSEQDMRAQKRADE